MIIIKWIIYIIIIIPIIIYVGYTFDYTRTIVDRKRCRCWWTVLLLLMAATPPLAPFSSPLLVVVICLTTLEYITWDCVRYQSPCAPHGLLLSQPVLAHISLTNSLTHITSRRSLVHSHIHNRTHTHTHSVYIYIYISYCVCTRSIYHSCKTPIV